MTQKEENLKHYATMKSDPHIRPAADSTIAYCVFSYGRLVCPNTGELCPVVHITNEPKHCDTCSEWTSSGDVADPVRGHCRFYNERRDGNMTICAEYQPVEEYPKYDN